MIRIFVYLWYGISNVNVKELVKFHKKHKKLATITAVKPLGRYGALDIIVMM